MTDIRHPDHLRAPHGHEGILRHRHLLQAPRRTSVLIREFVSFPPTSERSIKAISRMNYIHGGYQVSGKISHDDLLYTLSVFMTEPVRWVSR